MPYPPGGNVDITARIIGTPRSASCSGRPSSWTTAEAAAATSARIVVAKAPPDGYTLLMGSSGPLSVNPVVTPNLPYDSLKDYAPVSKVHVVPLVVLAGPKSGISTLKELIERAKAAPGKLTVASPGTGTTNHFGIELFSAMVGVKVVHVPYKGAGPALAELLGGQVATMFDQLSASIGYIRDGRLRALAIASTNRSSLLPSVPTLDESGLRGYEASTYIGVLATAGTPKPVISKLHAAMVKVMETPAVVDRFRGLGTEPGSSSPEEFRKLIRDELEKWRGVAKNAGSQVRVRTEFSRR